MPGKTRPSPGSLASAKALAGERPRKLAGAMGTGTRTIDRAKAAPLGWGLKF